MKEPSGLLEMFHILTWVVIMQAYYTYVNINQVVHLRGVLFTVCKLYLNKTNKKRGKLAVWAAPRWLLSGNAARKEKRVGF